MSKRYFYTDEQGRHRARHDENYQFLYYFMEEQRQSSDGLRPGKGFIRGLVPWEMMDSWSVDEACQAIVFGTDYDLDHEIDVHMKEGKAFTVMFDIGDVTWKVRHRFLEIAKSAFAIRTLKDPDTPKNWIAWAKSHRYSTDHLAGTKEAPEKEKAFPGRPPKSDRSAIEAEMRRRGESGQLLTTITQEANYLETWAENTFPDGVHSRAGTIKNNLRNLYKSLKPAKT